MFMMISNEDGLQKITAIGTWGKKYPNIFPFLTPVKENNILEKKTALFYSRPKLFYTIQISSIKLLVFRNGDHVKFTTPLI